MNTCVTVSYFQSFSVVLHHFLLAKLATRSIRVKHYECKNNLLCLRFNAIITQEYKYNSYTNKGNRKFFFFLANLLSNRKRFVRLLEREQYIRYSADSSLFHEVTKLKHNWQLNCAHDICYNNWYITPGSTAELVFL